MLNRLNLMKPNWITPESLNRFFLFCILIYTVTLFSFEKLHKPFEALVVLGCLWALYTNKSKLKHEPVLWLLVASLAIQIISWYNSLSIIPSHAASYPTLDRLAKLYLFIPLGILISSNQKNIIYIWICYFFALILACFSSPTLLADLNNAFHGLRVDFGIKNAMYTSAISGLCLLIAVYSFIYLFQNKNTKNIKSALLAIVIISLFILVVSQSRQTYLAYVLILLSLPVFYFNSIKQDKKKVFYILLVLVVISSAIYLVLINSLDPSKLRQMSSTISAIVNGTPIPMTSSGIRFNAWIEAWKLFIQHPIVGIDKNSAEYIFDTSPLFLSYQDNEMVSAIRHLHNSFMEYFLFYGLIGFTIILSTYGLIINSLFKFKKIIPNYNFWMNICIFTILYWIVLNNFESYNARAYGVATHNLICASIFSLYWNAKYKNGAQKTN